MAFINIVTGHTGVDHVTSNDDRHFNAAMIGDGDYVLSGGLQWAPTVIGANEVRLAAGEASIQGCHVRSDEPVEVVLEVGTSGYKRQDLIGVLYRNINGIESAELTYVKGVPTTGTAVDPEYIHDDILNGGAERFMPLVRASFNGTAISSVRMIGTVFAPVTDLSAQNIAYGDGTVADAINLTLSQWGNRRTIAVGETVTFNLPNSTWGIIIAVGVTSATGVIAWRSTNVGSVSYSDFPSGYTVTKGTNTITVTNSTSNSATITFFARPDIV